MKSGAVMTIGLLLIASVFAIIGPDGSGSGPYPDASRGYTTHAPIEIEGNNAFTLANGVKNGTGTVTDPYIIEGWDIDADTTDYGIYVGNTTKYFVIRNCRVHGANNGNGEINLVTRSSNGITFNNVLHGTVRGNILYDNAMADVHLYYSNLNTIEKNTISSKLGGAHILLEWSSNNTVILNDCDPHYRVWDPSNGTVTENIGIWLLYDSDDNIISYNTLRNFTQQAIFVSNNGCDRTLINYNVIQFSEIGICLSGEGHEVMDNLINYNSNTGIYADMLHYGVISRNLITHNGGSGMIVAYDGGFQAEGWNLVKDNIVDRNGLNGICAMGRYSDYYNNSIVGNAKDGVNVWKSRNTFCNNHIEKNGRYGIYIEARWKDPKLAVGNLILLNNIVNNTAPVQGLDECNDNHWNGSVKGNYWNDHTVPDNDSDGVVDTPYFVNMTNNVSDQKPMSKPFNIRTTGPIIPPKLVTDDVTAVQVNDTYDVTYMAFDPYLISGQLSWDVDTNASWLQVSGPHLTGTPAEMDVGRYWVNVSVNDGAEFDLRSFVLTVLPVPDDGTDPDNGTDPDDDPDNGTDPDDDDGNDTIPDDDQDNGTEPDDDDGNDTIPDDDQDNGTEPDDDDGNDTIPDDDQDIDDGTWNEMSNKAPSTATIEPPKGKIIAGKGFVLSAYAFDPDLGFGDSLTFDWYIEGIGYVGSGETIELTLDDGTYTVILIVTDHYGLKTERRMDLSVAAEAGAGFDPLPILMAIPVVLLLALMIASVFIYRRRTVHEMDGGEPVMDWGIDAPDSAPKDLRTISGNFSDVRAGPLQGRTGSDLRTFPGPLREGQMPALTKTEERTLSELRTDALITKRTPMKSKKRELRDLLRKKEGALDRRTYSALSSILEE